MLTSIEIPIFSAFFPFISLRLIVGFELGYVKQMLQYAVILSFPSVFCFVVAITDSLSQNIHVAIVAVV